MSPFPQKLVVTIVETVLEVDSPGAMFYPCLVLRLTYYWNTEPFSQSVNENIIGLL